MRDAFLMFVKIVFAVLLLPICYALTGSFIKELPQIGTMLPHLLLGGLLYVLLQLFFYTPQGLFQFGQKVFGDIFKAVPLLAAVVPLFVPIIPTMILVSCYVTVALFHYMPAQSYLMFFAGFTIAMHLILSAHAEFEEDASSLKPHYFFLFSLTYIFNIILVSLLLTLNFSDFSFTNIFASSFISAKAIYVSVYNQLFVMR
ncbi:MAG: hypothetical protein H6753_05755 [Candidatus Omnitrophica bacterium]|nr:hypothetical protein [Candidatus Omnitrophota bacterium]